MYFMFCRAFIIDGRGEGIRGGCGTKPSVRELLRRHFVSHMICFCHSRVGRTGYKCTRVVCACPTSTIRKFANNKPASSCHLP